MAGGGEEEEEEMLPKIPASLGAAAGPRLPASRQPSPPALGVLGWLGGGSWGPPKPWAPHCQGRVGWRRGLSPSARGQLYPLPPRQGPARPMRTQSRRSRGLSRSADPHLPSPNPRLRGPDPDPPCIPRGDRILSLGDKAAAASPLPPASGALLL